MVPGGDAGPRDRRAAGGVHGRVAANVTAFNTVVTYDLLQDYVWKDRDEAFYLRGAG